tara:strand:+ start:18858 stop:19478 length:621 start_codon:yes stop_codon:yes gene_type:complete
MALKKYFSIIFFIFFATQSSHALVELSGDFGYRKQVYGSQKQNDITDRSYGASIAVYLFDYTAVEFNYNQNETINDEHSTYSIDGTYDVVGSYNRVMNYSYGIGIRQAFASRKALIRPSISLGYARQFTRDTTSLTILNTTSGSSFEISDDPTKLRSDSVFGTFSLELRLTKRLALRGSVNTIFPAFQTDKARDNIKYMMGFSWYL